MAYPFHDVDPADVQRVMRAWHRYESTRALAAHEARDMSIAHATPLDEARGRSRCRLCSRRDYA